MELHHPTADSGLTLIETPGSKSFTRPQARKGVYQCGKTGWCYFLDRTNGKPLIGIDEKPVKQDARQATAATQPFPVGDAFSAQCGEPIENYQIGCIFDP